MAETEELKRLEAALNLMREAAILAIGDLLESEGKDRTNAEESLDFYLGRAALEEKR